MRAEQEAQRVQNKKIRDMAVALGSVNALTTTASTHWSFLVLQKLWCVSSLDVQTAPEGDLERSGYRVTESDECARLVAE